jgi:chitin synthase
VQFEEPYLYCLTVLFSILFPPLSNPNVPPPSPPPFLNVAQHFEYKLANALDKSFESIFGFVSVLPGAFCAFRMGEWAKEGDLWKDHGPLADRPMNEYFKPLARLQRDGYDSLSPFQKNMYLAEDRVFGFELVAKQDKAYVLRYVKGAVAVTDPMNSLERLIAQRRRWLNGSLFAKIRSIQESLRLCCRTKHSCCQKFCFFFQFLFFAIQLVVDWFS